MNISNALRGNAVFTTLCALSCFVCSRWIAAHIALPTPGWVWGLGALLVSYVPVLLFAAERPLAWLVKTIILLDWLFVATTSVFLLTHFRQVDLPGLALIIGSAGSVALFAYIQRRELSASLAKEN